MATSKTRIPEYIKFRVARETRRHSPTPTPIALARRRPVARLSGQPIEVPRGPSRGAAAPYTKMLPPHNTAIKAVSEYKRTAPGWLNFAILRFFNIRYPQKIRLAIDPAPSITHQIRFVLENSLSPAFRPYSAMGLARANPMLKTAESTPAPAAESSATLMGRARPTKSPRSPSTPILCSRRRPATPHKAIPITSMATPATIIFPVKENSFRGTSKSIGSNDPSAELIASTRVLAKEIPIALTLCPNMMAPKPQVNPAAMAIQIACLGACARTVQLCGAIAARITVGRSKQENAMKTLHTFSHSQRPKKRIGSVKLPFISPDKIANSEPTSSVFFISPPRISRERLS